jgi:ATP-binding cassette subfamily B (MDR/TAP) protein 1
LNDLEYGIKVNNFIGNIQFENVRFAYPSRPSVPVLENFSFTAQHGEITAIVGISGCGKVNC